ncbi:MAG: cobalt-precorrin-6A reductase [Thalassobaculales bacterium]
MRVLVLGGTGEARRLAEAASGSMEVVLSLAGRTADPRLPAVRVRIGGFGGAAGLQAWLAAEGIDAVVDATHPFAARISANAALACRQAGLPLARLERPAWLAGDGDDWRPVPDMAAAAAALGPRPRRVFLSIGRQEVAAFAAAPWHNYLIRAIEAPVLPPALTGARVILARGPFTAAAEEALLRAENIEVIVSKNAGGPATAAKLAAARRLALPVVMVARPEKPAGMPLPATVPAALEWLHHVASTTTPRGV